MKRYIIWSSLVVVLILAAIAIARAEGRGWRGWCDHRWHHHGPLGYVAHELDLSQGQQSQIQSIWQTERPTISALVHEFAAEAKEMDTATVQGNLDESKVQEIAARQGATITKLLVEKERLKSKIYTTVLNSEQRTKADALQERWHSRLDRIAGRIGNG
jgi:Spy/CpxP family protein refolding chaperone